MCVSYIFELYGRKKSQKEKQCNIYVYVFHPLRLLFGLLELAHNSLTCPNQYSQQNQITFWIRSKFYEISRKLFQKSNFIFTLLISFVTLKRRTNYYDANFDNSSKPFANGQKIPTSMTQRESLCKLLLKTCHVIRSLVEFLPSSKRHTTQVCKWRVCIYWYSILTFLTCI